MANDLKSWMLPVLKGLRGEIANSEPLPLAVSTNNVV